MKALTYIERGKFALLDKTVPEILDPRDAIVRVTLSSICTSDLHIKHGSVPRAVPGITVGHEMVGVVEAIGSGVRSVKPGDRVTVNVETFCGECFFCRHGFVNNCTDPNGGCDCAEILSLIEAGKIDTTPLITHRYKLEDIEEAYHLFENKLDGVIKVAITAK